MRAWLKGLSPEARDGYLRSLKGTREGTGADTIFKTIVAGFEWMKYVACSGCKEWMPLDGGVAGAWAVDHRNCSSFRFSEDMGEIPEDYFTPLGEVELLASLAAEWEEE
tara:strand:+ start:865 stop:1191 length:327 start_codon:yes stop_codon:yes gene_type:complete